MLQKLCAAIGLPWDKQMLHWPAGPKPYDGVWAPHWYNAVHGSTGFATAEGPLPQVAEHHRPILDHAMVYYEAMKSRALRLS